jgi:hypothetical protein
MDRVLHRGTHRPLPHPKALFILWCDALVRTSFSFEYTYRTVSESRKKNLHLYQKSNVLTDQLCTYVLYFTVHIEILDAPSNYKCFSLHASSVWKCGTAQYWCS